MQKINGKGRKDGEARHVRLYHWLTRSEAWRELDTVARCAYLEIAARYGGPNTNNGRIPFSVREMAAALNVSKATARRAMKRLEAHGFVVETKRGAFSVKVRHASEWRLTEHSDQHSLATKDFMRWRKNTVSPESSNGQRHEPVRAAA